MFFSFIFKVPKYSVFTGSLELEIDERAAVRAHELVNHEDDERRAEHHQGDGLRCERDAVAALPLLGNPVDEHARDKHEDDVDVLPGDGSEGIPLPGPIFVISARLAPLPPRSSRIEASPSENK